MAGFIQSVQDNPAAFGMGVSALGAGAYAGISEYKQDKDQVFEEKLGRSGRRAVAGMLGGAGLFGIGYLGFKERKKVAKGLQSAGDYAVNAMRGVYDQAHADYTFLKFRVPADEAHAIRMVEAGIKPLSVPRAYVEAFGRNPKIMGGAGAVAGAAIGTAYGHPFMGAAIGAGAGLAVKSGIGAYSMWEKAGKYLGARTAGVLGLSAMVFAGGLALSPNEYEADMTASPEGITPTNQDSNMRERMRSMKATGDVVLGMSNSRHG